MLAGIITGYLAIGTIATAAMEISARIGAKNNEDDQKMCDLIDSRPFYSRTNLIIGWPDWVIGGMVKGIKTGMSQWSDKEEK